LLAVDEDQEALPLEAAVQAALGLHEATDQVLERFYYDVLGGEDHWTDEQLAVLVSTLRITEAQGISEDAPERLGALFSSLVAKLICREGLRLLVEGAMTGSELGDGLSRLAGESQARLARALAVDPDFGHWLGGLKPVDPARTAWLRAFAESAGVALAPEDMDADITDQDRVDPWDALRDLAVQHQRVLRRCKREETRLGSARADALHLAAREMARPMERFEAILQAYHLVRSRLAEAGLAPSVELTSLVRDRSSIDPARLRVPADTEDQQIHLESGGFADAESERVLRPAMARGAGD
jgi:hypothetical protein